MNKHTNMRHYSCHASRVPSLVVNHQHLLPKGPVVVSHLVVNLTLGKWLVVSLTPVLKWSKIMFPIRGFASFSACLRKKLWKFYLLLHFQNRTIFMIDKKIFGHGQFSCVHVCIISHCLPGEYFFWQETWTWRQHVPDRADVGGWSLVTSGRKCSTKRDESLKLLGKGLKTKGCHAEGGSARG